MTPTKVNGAALTVAERGVARTDYADTAVKSTAEVAMAAVAAREEAIIKAEYVMAERHPRNWSDVRAQMLDHCSRTRFAEVSRYAKPVGKKLVNGEWIEEKAKGWTARFAETLRQEMGNIKPVSAVTYEDDMIRVVRFGVCDLQRNVPASREVTFAKAVEKRGRKGRDGAWLPPDGREVISQRLNSHGEPVFLVKATDDEMRNKVNSEESKTQRDFTLRLCPRDILEECEERVFETLTAEDQRDPAAASKKILDKFHGLGVLPSDLEQYTNKTARQWLPADIQELRDLYSAIRDGQTTLNEAMRVRYAAVDDMDPEEAKAAAAEVLTRKKGAATTAERRAAAETLAKPATLTPKPPAHLEDGDRFPDFDVAWCKVRGVIYQRTDDGTGPKWTKHE